jgi:AP2 domain
MKNKIIYSPKERVWRVHFFNKEKGTFSTASYSDILYGDYGQMIAERTILDGKRAYNVIEEFKDYAVLVTFSKTYGVTKTLIDLEDVPKVSEHVWRATWSRRTNSYYIISSSAGKLHRFIMNIRNTDNVVDHIDRDSLNNRKFNLREVSQSINTKNAGMRSDNTSGIKGIRFNEKRNRWESEIWVDNKKYTKTFAVSKYGDTEAKRLAMEFRREIAEANGYKNYF